MLEKMRTVNNNFLSVDLILITGSLSSSIPAVKFSVCSSKFAVPLC